MFPLIPSHPLLLQLRGFLLAILSLQPNSLEGNILIFQQGGFSPIGSGQLNGSTSSTKTNSLRHSLDLKYMNEGGASDTILSSAGNHIITTPPKLQSSYSTGDVNANKSTTSQNFGSSPNNHAQQHFHNHNASLGRIPAGAMPTRHTRELSNEGSPQPRDQSSAYPSIQSTLQGSAAPFGPTMASPAVGPGPNMGAPNQAGYPYYVGNNFGPAGPPSTGAGNFGVPLMAMGLQNMNLNGYSNGGYASAYTPGYPGSSQQQRDSQARVIQNRRQLDNEGKYSCIWSYPYPSCHLLM